MAHIDYFLFTLSPFTYLAGDRLETIARKHRATIAYKPFDLIQAFARTGGVPLAERPQARLDYRAQDLVRSAKKLGLPLNVKPAHFPTNPAPSSFAIIAAQKAGGGDTGALCRAILRACWAEQKDVAEDGVIRACLAEAGFDPSLADTGLFSGAEIYERTLEQAVASGVFGAPFYIVDDVQKFWGQDRLDDLDLHLAGKL